nr:T-cell receptor gamma chain [Ginglymostoma cirratum]
MLVSVACFSCSGLAQSLRQPMLSVSRARTKMARFRCILEDVDFASVIVHWYRHTPSQGFRRILYVTGARPVYDDDLADRFTSENVEKEKSSLLDIRNIAESDAGVYYCAIWDVGALLQFGTGTRLVVTGYNVREPKIQTFGPNETELDLNNRAAVVCLLTDFFPEVIRVQWIIGDKNAPSDQVLTDAVEKQENDAYSVVSRLIITKLEWTSQNISCRAEHETNPAKVTIPKESPGANLTPDGISVPTCGPTVQNISTIVNEGQPLSSLKLATFTYTLLLVKSVVYCGIISILFRLEHRDVKKPL